MSNPVPAGYKMTEVGIIPDDWEVKALGDFVSISSGESPSKFRLKDQGIPYFKVDQLNNSEKYQISTPYFIECNTPIAQGSLIFPKRGASILLNKIRILGQDSYMDTNLMTLTVSREELDHEFLFYLLIHMELWRIADITSIPQINNKHIIPFPIPLPPTLAEQRAIADALSDVDAQITALDDLIAKKRAIKQGTMQRLLTGEQRLPGFSGEWEERSFNDLFVMLKTASNPRSHLSNSGDVQYIHYGDIHQRWSTYLDCEKESLPYIDQIRVQSIPFVKTGDLIMADASEDYEGIGASVEVKNVGEKNIVAGLHTLLLRGNDELLANGFKGYLQYMPNIKRQLIEIATGISVYGISKSNIRSIVIALPKIEEQKAIASVLSDMDAEIRTLEEKREKVATLKGGMMQELLTGRTRLI